jgi:hypothetical protein
MEWMSRLRPRTPVSVDTSALSEDGLWIYERFGVDGLGWSIETSEEVLGTILASMPALAAEATLPHVFMRGMRAEVLREMRMAAGDDIDPLTDEAADVARDFVRRGLGLTMLLESIRIGGAVSASAFITGANELVEDPEQRADETRRLSELFFGTLEHFSTTMSEVYALERARWRASQSAERLGIVNSLLSGRPVAPRSIDEVLQYDPAARHVALVAWSESASFDDAEKLVKAASDELRLLGATSTIVVPVGIGTAWGWGAVPDRPAAATPPPSTPPPGVFVAVGQAHAGEAGFRRAHREARSVEHLLRLAVPETPRTLRHADVELATLLAADLENAQHFVRRQLGPLAIDDDRMESLRTTLWLYLENERSVAAVASLQFVARNTVTYRVKQAEQLIGRRIDDVRLNLQSALLLTRLLGDRVLVRP